jgi:hypothetical protein
MPKLVILTPNRLTYQITLIYAKHLRLTVFFSKLVEIQLLGLSIWPIEQMHFLKKTSPNTSTLHWILGTWYGTQSQDEWVHNIPSTLAGKKNPLEWHVTNPSSMATYYNLPFYGSHQKRISSHVLYQYSQCITVNSEFYFWELNATLVWNLNLP